MTVLSQAEKLMQQYFSKRDEEKREMRQLVETIMQGHNSAKAAKTKLQKMKRKIGTEFMIIFNSTS